MHDNPSIHQGYKGKGPHVEPAETVDVDIVKTLFITG